LEKLRIVLGRQEEELAKLKAEECQELHVHVQRATERLAKLLSDVG
jgi:hypothetical protein